MKQIVHIYQSNVDFVLWEWISQTNIVTKAKPRRDDQSTSNKMYEQLCLSKIWQGDIIDNDDRCNMTISSFEWPSSGKGNIMWGKTPKWLVDFSCLLLDSDSVSYWNIWQEIVNVYWQNRGKNGYLSSHQSSAKYEDTTKTKYLSTWLFWLINPLSRLIKMNIIDTRTFFNTAYSVSKNNWLFSDIIFLSEIQI